MFYSYTCMCMQKTKDTFSIYVRLLSSNVGSSTFGSVISKSDLEGKRKVILINNIILRKRRILILKDMNLKFTYCQNKKKIRGHIFQALCSIFALFVFLYLLIKVFQNICIIEF